MPKTVSVAEAKARFSAVLRSAEGGRPVVITRHGKPVAALVRADELEQIERLRAAGPEGGLASLAGGWKDSEELVDLIHAR
ncbi:MAG: type II toxin-antitoxin system Phd/YefM family antitoxin, partial [Gemmatimonadetes bacterium]|nr:type II toxin-antitoxin system Phd/YefM family antitoxin [Gemmatimonadota bacterium]